MRQKTIEEIASFISRDWQRPNHRASEFLGRMKGGDNSADTIKQFLANANGWRGERAREVKAELRRRLS